MRLSAVDEKEPDVQSKYFVSVDNACVRMAESVAYLAYLVRGGKQRHRSIFWMGGGGGKS